LVFLFGYINQNKNIDMLIKLGSKGGDVKSLQEKLGLTADGSFGPGTEKAVKEWQSKNGLTADGIIGDTSWSKLFSIVKESVVIPASEFKLEALKGHLPDSVIAQIPDTAKKFNITNVLRLSHFLAQCGHESGGFKAVSENLNYSADGLKKIFGKYFPGDATSYARNPEKIASKVYANRMGNGNEASGDGWKYRGRGYIQCTGRLNYLGFSKFIGEDCVTNPDLVSTKYPMASAAWFFDKNNLWKICDLGSTDDVVTKVTKKINGGVNGLLDRQEKFDKFWKILK
jgi:putative chitinase